MPDSDAGFKIIARHDGHALCRMAGVYCHDWTPLGDTMQATERLADRAFLGTQGEQRFVAYFEAYTRWQADAPWSMLAKSGLLSERERLPTRCFAFILLPKGYHEQNGQFRLAIEKETTQHLWFREICLWQIEPQPWWEDVPGLMTLLPFCKNEQEPEQVIQRAAEAIKQKTESHVLRADLLAVLGIFGRLAMPKIDVLHLIGREQMKESPFYQEILAEGKLETKREDVLEVLQIRFGSQAASEFQGPLDAINDREHLAELHRLAVKCKTITPMRRALKAAKSSP